jgi:hypothetical protein
MVIRAGLIASSALLRDRCAGLLSDLLDGRSFAWQDAEKIEYCLGPVDNHAISEKGFFASSMSRDISR